MKVAEPLTLCFHCGLEPAKDDIVYKQKKFCCEGCKSVYQILTDNNLTDFYAIDAQARTSNKSYKKIEELAYLDNPAIADKLLDFKSKNLHKVTFKAPAIHCSSCIWLLENLYKINDGVLNSKVNFVKKEIYIDYNPLKISLKELVYLLSKIGYEPDITLESIKNGSKKTQKDRTLWYKLGVAGFAFGNIMLFSLPSYFGLEADGTEKDFDLLFKALNVVLSLPVLFYSASEFLNSAYNSLKNKQINLDVPLCLGILALFGTSMYEIFSNTGPGYLDSFTALIFFLLAGRAVQKLSFEKLKFDRDNSSYFPLSVLKLTGNKEEYIAVTDLKIGDRILIRNNELIPADGSLFKGNACIDYSFVTGETLPVTKEIEETLYAGGRQTAGAIELIVSKEPSKSYLTQLWNQHIQTETQKENFESVVNKISKYFTYAVLLVALGAFAFWTYHDGLAKGILVMATTLNVSCPCALAVAIPFTYANIIKHLGRNNFYLKNPQIVEKISQIDTIVFDKTGTLTQLNASEISYEGFELTPQEISIIKSGLRQSTHPLSVQLYQYLHAYLYTEVSCEEIINKGLLIKSATETIKIGSAGFVYTNTNMWENTDLKTAVYVSVNDVVKGRYVFNNKYIDGIDQLISDLQKNQYQADVVSGDNESEKTYLQKWLGHTSTLLFNQKPENKLQYICSLQEKGKNVMMVGDGLNDSIALQQSNVGVAVIHNNTQFSPSSDVIMHSDHTVHLYSYIKYCKSGIEVIKKSFLFSSMYNVLGLSFAVQGLFSPVFAAILMPVSSITVVLFANFLTNLYAKKILKNQ